MIFIYSSQIVIQQTTIKLEIISILNQQICHYLINLLNQPSERSGEGGGAGEEYVSVHLKKPFCPTADNLQYRRGAHLFYIFFPVRL